MLAAPVCTKIKVVIIKSRFRQQRKILQYQNFEIRHFQKHRYFPILSFLVPRIFLKDFHQETEGKTVVDITTPVTIFTKLSLQSLSNTNILWLMFFLKFVYSSTSITEHWLSIQT